MNQITETDILPNDGLAGTLVGRVWCSESDGSRKGPHVVILGEDGVYDLSGYAPTISHLLDDEELISRLGALDQLPKLCSIADLISNSQIGCQSTLAPYLLAPVDLQCLKACGVTFANSIIERVIEEQAGGDPSKAESIRESLLSKIGSDLSGVVPGSAEALALRESMIVKNIWSQYLEVGIGPYAEVFTKAPVMSSVGYGMEAGLHPESSWNNPEPELVLAVNSRGVVVGATLGNDVNLRDFEGRSALLLGKAKDNNASCAVGPFIRLFDETFDIEDVRNEVICLRVEGKDGFVLQGESTMSEISRDVLELVEHTYNSNHQYPDGFILFTGTLFAPTQDRDEIGGGFTHKIGDIVSISSGKLGCLRNEMNTSDQITPWSFGIRDLFDNLTKRKLI